MTVLIKKKSKTTLTSTTKTILIAQSINNGVSFTTLR